MLDDNTDGFLSYEEFKKLTTFENFKEFSESDLKNVYLKADTNKDSKVSFEEFSDLVYELTLDDDETDDEYEDKRKDDNLEDKYKNQI